MGYETSKSWGCDETCSLKNIARTPMGFVSFGEPYKKKKECVYGCANALMINYIDKF